MKISWSKILALIILIIAYSIVLYELITYDNYNELFSQLKIHGSKNWPYIIITLLLIPLNLVTEAIKWKYSVSLVENVSLKKALYATIIGQVGAIATPNKLGDFPTRSLVLSEGNKTKATILGFISGWTLPMVIIIIGVFSSFFYMKKYNAEDITNKYLIGVIICCILIIIAIFSIPKITKKLTQYNRYLEKIKSIIVVLSQMSTIKLIKITLLSFLRYLIFCSQLFFILHFVDISITVPQALMTIPTIYLLTTLTPSTIASEAATRSSYAILILSPICSTAPTITIATTLLWCFNNGIPLIIGMLIFSPKIVKFKL